MVEGLRVLRKLKQLTKETTYVRKVKLRQVDKNENNGYRNHGVGLFSDDSSYSTSKGTRKEDNTKIQNTNIQELSKTQRKTHTTFYFQIKVKIYTPTGQKGFFLIGKGDIKEPRKQFMVDWDRYTPKEGPKHISW